MPCGCGRDALLGHQVAHPRDRVHERRVGHLCLRPVGVQLRGAGAVPERRQAEVEVREREPEDLAVTVARGQLLGDGQEVVPGPVVAGPVDARVREHLGVVVDEHRVPGVRQQVQRAVQAQAVEQPLVHVADQCGALRIVGHVVREGHEQVRGQTLADALDGDADDVRGAARGDLGKDDVEVVAPAVDGHEVVVDEHVRVLRVEALANRVVDRLVVGVTPVRDGQCRGGVRGRWGVAATAGRRRGRLGEGDGRHRGQRGDTCCTRGTRLEHRTARDEGLIGHSILHRDSGGDRQLAPLDDPGQWARAERQRLGVHLQLVMDPGGQPHESRCAIRGMRRTVRTGASGFWRRRSSRRIPSRPTSNAGCTTLVSRGLNRSAYAGSSKVANARSRGISSPTSRTACRALMLMSMLALTSGARPVRPRQDAPHRVTGLLEGEADTGQDERGVERDAGRFQRLLVARSSFGQGGHPRISRDQRDASVPVSMRCRTSARIGPAFSTPTWSTSGVESRSMSTTGRPSAVMDRTSSRIRARDLRQQQPVDPALPECLDRRALEVVVLGRVGEQEREAGSSRLVLDAPDHLGEHRLAGVRDDQADGVRACPTQGACHRVLPIAGLLDGRDDPATGLRTDRPGAVHDMGHRRDRDARDPCNVGDGGHGLLLEWICPRALRNVCAKGFDGLCSGPFAVVKRSPTGSERGSRRVRSRVHGRRHGLGCRGMTVRLAQRSPAGAPVRLGFAVVASRSWPTAWMRTIAQDWLDHDGRQRDPQPPRCQPGRVGQVRPAGHRFRFAAWLRTLVDLTVRPGTAGAGSCGASLRLDPVDRATTVTAVGTDRSTVRASPSEVVPYDTFRDCPTVTFLRWDDGHGMVPGYPGPRLRDSARWVHRPVRGHPGVSHRD